MVARNNPIRRTIVIRDTAGNLRMAIQGEIVKPAVKFKLKDEMTWLAK